ncbi:unnamed protein product [Strongylus vulgaris]|uniref:Uncharacterized protein n=1 Tax=Strongylus vulgaris TaxID=40348 RepID=A0A3P7K313_STRVU|nr:unnamed protein product [Strongylus vulgaris]
MMVLGLIGNTFTMQPPYLQNVATPCSIRIRLPISWRVEQGSSW